MQSLVSLSYLPDTMLCLSFSFSAAVAAADSSSSSSSSLHCIQLQLLWRLLFVLHFLLCFSLSLAPSTHTFFRTVPILCIFCLLRFLLLLFFDAHTSHWLLFFLSLWPFICPVVVVDSVVVAVCIFFAIFSHLLCSVASFVRSAALNFNLPNEHETCVRVCVCV